MMHFNREPVRARQTNHAVHPCPRAGRGECVPLRLGPAVFGYRQTEEMHHLSLSDSARPFRPAGTASLRPLVALARVSAFVVVVLGLALASLPGQASTPAPR